MVRILLAEDEEALRALTARALADAGHEVVTAVDGADARHSDARARPFRAAADRHQDAADGRHRARDHPHIIILLMTAYADQRERASNLDAPIHDVILKPFTLAEIKAVSEALAASRATPWPDVYSKRAIAVRLRRRRTDFAQSEPFRF